MILKLKAASETDNPWREGKRILQEVGAETQRLVDLFKRKPVWRQIIQLDGKGNYRFNTSLFSSSTQRVRIFRLSRPHYTGLEPSASWSKSRRKIA